MTTAGLTAGLVRRNLGWAVRDGWTGARGAVRAMAEVLEAAGHVCAYCGGRATTAHHLTPVHVIPDAAGDPENLVATCRVCHLRVWHAGSWRRWVAGLRFAMLQGRVKVEK